MARATDHEETAMPAITPSLWFDDGLEDAIAFYTSVFPNSSVGRMHRYTEAGPGTPGEVVSAEFTLDGQRFIGISGGPPFTEAVSFTVHCTDQDEVDHYWDRLVEGGQESQCGWLKDRYGLSWQVIPDRLQELIADPDPARAQAATKAMLGMRRIVIAELEEAVANM
jgi:predicted 3-demethylubiquinone-9 3-methyltransferase (glyoxalase superfamily)